MYSAEPLPHFVDEYLAYLHELRPPIIHRDVKPGNIVLAPDGEAWLVDFGAVRDRILHEIRTEGEGATIVGTYGYMPYEQFQGRALPASDVYALGMTLVFLLSHKEPHEIEAASGRLEKTLVIMLSEFGRTPRINDNAGRDHHPNVFSCLLAGGGIRGGQVIGSSDEDGVRPKDRPVNVPDIHASLCHALGIDPSKEVMTPLRRPMKLVDGGKTVTELFA